MLSGCKVSGVSLIMEIISKMVTASDIAVQQVVSTVCRTTKLKLVDDQDGGLSRDCCDATNHSSTIYRLFPFIAILSKYNVRSDLPTDVMTGHVVGIMHIPQGQYQYNHSSTAVLGLHDT